MAASGRYRSRFCIERNQQQGPRISFSTALTALDPILSGTFWQTPRVKVDCRAATQCRSLSSAASGAAHLNDWGALSKL